MMKVSVTFPIFFILFKGENCYSISFLSLCLCMDSALKLPFPEWKFLSLHKMMFASLSSCEMFNYKRTNLPILIIMKCKLNPLD